MTHLSEFQNRFIYAFPTGCVNMVQLQIRLAPVEREIIRNKKAERPEANIIRPNCSPYSSPIILTKF